VNAKCEYLLIGNLLGREFRHCERKSGSTANLSDFAWSKIKIIYPFKLPQKSFLCLGFLSAQACHSLCFASVRCGFRKPDLRPYRNPLSWISFSSSLSLTMLRKCSLRLSQTGLTSVQKSAVLDLLHVHKISLSVLSTCQINLFAARYKCRTQIIGILKKQISALNIDKPKIIQKRINM